MNRSLKLMGGLLSQTNIWASVSMVLPEESWRFGTPRYAASPEFKVRWSCGWQVPKPSLILEHYKLFGCLLLYVESMLYSVTKVITCSDFTLYLRVYLTRPRLVQSAEPPLTVLHYEYLEWPDYYVPLSTRSVRELTRALFNIPPRAGPFVVHCRYTLFVLWNH